jgi:hypothetical protein
MTGSGLRRFADVRLGEAVSGASPADGSLGWRELARQFVESWAGAQNAGVTHCRAPSPAARPRHIEARIFARHLDESRCVDVEVIGRDRGLVCASAMVRVALR